MTSTTDHQKTAIEPNVYAYSANTLEGEIVPMDSFRGKVLLIVNVASECGFTPQYEGLEKLWKSYKDNGFTVLGFPSNEFRSQEPGDSKQIRFFCTEKYQITFPLFEKTKVNGKDAHPLFKFLRSEKKGVAGTESIKWNFTKFLVDRQGLPIKRYAPTTKPESIEPDIKAALSRS